MAKRRTVRNPKRGVHARGNSPSSIKPRTKRNPKAVYLFTSIVAGHPIPVFQVDRFRDPRTCGESTSGPINEIFVIKGQSSPQSEADTMFHEHLHMISNITLAPEDWLSERQVNTVTLEILDLLRRNPHLRDYIWERL